MTQAYDIPDGLSEIIYEVKKSRFIARAILAEDRSQAMAHIAQAKSDFPDARHYCWAYVLGAPHSPVSVAMSDDGEPSGTAGKPILNVVQHKSIGNIMVVVIRYFGGIKLGAGGLVRAYSQATQQVIECLPVQRLEPVISVTVIIDYSVEQALRHWLDTRRGCVIAVDYISGVHVRVEIAPIHREALIEFIVARGGEVQGAYSQ